MTLPIGTKIPLFAEGNADISDVLEGVTFSTSSGINLVGTMKKMYNNIFEPKKNDVYGDIGYYGKGVHVLPITNEIIKKNFNSDEILNIVDTNNLSKNNIENFINGVTQKYPKICGKKYAEGQFIEEGEHNMYTRTERFNITGLNFKPSTVMCYVECGMHYLYCYTDEISNFSDFKSIGYNHGICEKFNSKFTSNGFEIYCGDIRTKKVKIKWIAYS